MIRRRPGVTSLAMSTGSGGWDPDEWVHQGWHEPSAQERLAESERQWREAALAARLAIEGDRMADATRRRRRRRRGFALVWVVAIVGLVAIVWESATRTAPTPFERAAERLRLGEPVETEWGDSRRPTPQVESTTPLGEPAEVPLGSGDYGFVAMRTDRDGPVAYDPCRTIRLVVNGGAMPSGGDRTLARSVQRVSELTGLQFENEGPTDEIDSDGRAAFQPDRYGNRWAPVLIWWATPETAPKLRGAVAGYAGSARMQWFGSGRTGDAFVTGVVVLDGPQLEELRERAPRGEEQVQAIVMHELGHLVGLDHVRDRTQLMYPEGNPEVRDFRAGDIRGLRELGAGECFADL